MDELLDPFARLLESIADRTAEEQLSAVDKAGFLDLLVPDAAGGAGLTLADAQPLIEALGRHAIEAPIAEAMMRRALGNNDIAPELGAVIAAAEIAGLAAAVLEMSIDLAQTRQQFGKPVARQQAVQQNLAIIAEQVAMARMAGQMGCAHGLAPSPEIAATAKQVASSAAVQIAALAHAVHGAIGITREHRLHRYTRRLHSLRLQGGSESYWAEALGKVALRQSQGALEFVRAYS